MNDPTAYPRCRSEVIHRGPGFQLGRFECPVGAPLWSEENWIGERHHIVFPQTTVLIKQRGIEVVADPNVAVLYDGDQTYCREPIDPRGDRCFYAAVDAELIEEMLGENPRASRPSFPDVSVTIDARTYALQWRTVRTYETHDRVASAIDEAVLRVLGHIVGMVSSRSVRRKENGQRAIVERTKRVLHETLNEPLSLSEIASLAHVSPYHLTRLFRRHTGMSLHRYRTQLRLRHSLERLERGRESLREIAARMGFSSHSHFSARFRDAFGFTPTEWRQGDPDLCRLATGVVSGSQPPPV